MGGRKGEVEGEVAEEGFRTQEKGCVQGLEDV